MIRTIKGTEIDFIGYDKEHVYYYYNYRSRKAKLYYRHPKTWKAYWSDRFGLFFYVRFPNGLKKRVWFNDIFHR